MTAKLRCTTHSTFNLITKFIVFSAFHIKFALNKILKMSDKERDSIASTASSSVSSVQEKWVSKDNQTGWPIIHDRIIEYRKYHKLSIKKFLQHCGLSQNSSYFQQLCCTSGKNLHPSNKSGSVGKKYLDSVKSFLESKTVELNDSLDVNIDHIICDLEHEENHKFEELGISRIIFKDEDHGIIINCLEASNEEAICSYLREKFDLEKLVVQFRKIELLVSSPQQICNYEVSKIGTSTTLNLTGTLVAITCAHCVSEFFSTVYKISNFNIDPKEFGNVIQKYPELDIALINPLPRQSVLVNSVFYESSFTDLSFNIFWDDEKPGLIRDYLLNKTVFKAGATTGMTNGKVVDIDDEAFLVDNSFATFGDSGSLVFTEEGYVVGILTGKIIGGSRTEVRGIWRFYDYLTEWD